MPKSQLANDCENTIQPLGNYEHGEYEEASFHAAVEVHNDGYGYGEYAEEWARLSDSKLKALLCQSHQQECQLALHD